MDRVCCRDNALGASMYLERSKSDLEIRSCLTHSLRAARRSRTFDGASVCIASGFRIQLRELNREAYGVFGDESSRLWSVLIVCYNQLACLLASYQLFLFGREREGAEFSNLKFPGTKILSISRLRIPSGAHAAFDGQLSPRKCPAI